jgi:hypothetical protein
MSIDNAWFDGDALVGDIDCKDAVHSRKADYDSTLSWKRAARESGAGSASNKGDAMSSTDSDDGLHFVSGSRQHYCGRQSAKCGKAIAFICLKLISLNDNSIRTNDSAKLSKHLMLKPAGIWRLAQHLVSRLKTDLSNKHYDT